MIVTRDRYRAVSNTLPLLIPCLPSEVGQPAAFAPPLPGSHPLRVRALAFDEAAKALRETQRHAERGYYAGLVALLQAIQSGNREAQELAVQRLQFPPPQEQDIRKRMGTDWLRSTPLSIIESAVAEDKGGNERLRKVTLAAIRSVREANEPHRFLCYEITRTLLERVQLVLWWDGERFLPALFCEDRTTALYIRVLLKAARGRGLATCLKCGEWFVQDRANQYYCSIAHREA